ncbi:Glucan endo-1,3-beta-glucosidase [Thalictrum thalictroides]|uniref:Glucan endo-1,3-beta-glucosidase n=1 Tax=Thalictrum thalictroides TaxID=46969 RepID=A0A7J6W7D2_THATH|nr:Glucan endo-1,3-beta-glucosidase [Thalictrum thalictroides]
MPVVLKRRRSYFMKLPMDCIRLFFGFLCLSIAATPFTQCEARVSKQLKHIHPFRQVSSAQIATNKKANQLKIMKHLEMDDTGSNTQPYVSSPFTLPPFDSLPPMPLPQNTPPYCEYPPSTPQPPSTVIPSPTTYTMPPPSPETSYFPPIFPIENPPPSPAYDVPSPPESSTLPNPPEYSPSPPYFAPGTPNYIPSPPSPPAFVPGTPEYVPSPPDYYVPGPPETTPGTPGYEPSPPIYYPSPISYTPSPSGYYPSPTVYYPSPIGYTPSPSGYTPSPTVFQPPVIYPPPAVPPPPFKGPYFTRWCVAKPSVPDPIIEEAMNYACGSGADCRSIQPDGTCYKPDTLFAHASYAFNSYWQRTKAAGGTCDFGGTGMLVTVDPSKFIIPGMHHFLKKIIVANLRVTMASISPK